MSKNLLLIFTRNPELGKVKTRLAKSVGNETALKIYKFLLHKTRKIAINVNADKAVYYSVKIRENDIWHSENFQKHQQIGEDLGARMQHAFENGFDAGYEKIIIIGSDLYDLKYSDIEEAYELLNRNDVVIGPAKDGGYYLLGLKTVYPEIFKNKAWGTETVRKETLQDLQDKKVHLLHELNDVDVVEDIKHHEAFQKFLN